MTPNPLHKAIDGASSSAYGSEVGVGGPGATGLHIVPWGQIKAYSLPKTHPLLDVLHVPRQKRTLQVLKLDI